MRTALLATVGIGLVAAGAWTRIDTPLTLQPESRLWVEGTSTTKAWTCKATGVAAGIVATHASAPAAIVAGEKAVRSVTVTVATPRIDCGNGTMTSHALKALKAQEHRTITFSLGSYELAKGADGARGTLSGSLTLGGITRPVAIVALARPAGARRVRITGTHDLRMSDYGLEAPSLMMGAMKVGDKVTVGFDLLLEAAPPASPTP